MPTYPLTTPQTDRPIRVLHVDDDQHVLDIVRSFLERESDQFTVVTETTTTDGLERLEQEQIDCVVSDHDMPEMTGLAFLEAVRESDPELPFILFTGKGSEEIASRAIQAGVSDYLQKRTGTDQYELLAQRVRNAVERYRTERQLEDARKRYELVTRASADAFFDWDIQSETATVDDYFEQHFGYDPSGGDSPLDWWVERIHEDDRDAAREALFSTFEAGETVYEDEYRLRLPNGTMATVAAEGHVVYEDDEPARMVGVYRDITERKQRESVLETLHEAATDIQACVTEQAVYDRTVEAAETILEFAICSVTIYEDGMLVPKSVSTESPDDGARPMDPDQGLAGKTFQQGESFVVNDVETEDDSDPAKQTYRSGISVPIGDFGVFQAVSAEPDAFDENDRELAELLLTHTGQSVERLRFEQQLNEQTAELRHQNERLEEFANVVSHDLKNPLNVAHARLELVRETGDEEHFEHVDRALGRMEQIVEDVLTLARQGDTVEDTTSVALSTLIEECWQTIETDDATVDVTDDVTFQADPARIRHVLENLMRNAVEHGTDTVSEARDVTVTVGALDDGFYVEDDGHGLPETDREDIFEPGYSTSDDGTGFGLNIVKRMVEAHGWTIDATESQSGGARFEITGVETV